MPQPENEPTTLALVKAHLGITDDDDDGKIQPAVDATNAQVRRLPSALAVDTAVEGVDDWPADIVVGATMMAARVFRRRNSPGGVEGFTETFAVYVTRHDPDIARLLQIAGFAPVALG